MDQNQNNFDPSSSVPPHWSIIQHPNHDPEQPMMPTDQMPQFDQSSSFPSYSQTDNVAVFQQSPMTIMPPPPPQNQPIRIESNDNGSRPRGYKTEAEMMAENYLEEYSRSIDPQDESDLLNFDPVPMNFLNFENTAITGNSNSNNDTTQFFTPSVHSNFSAPAPIECTGCLSDVVNCCFGRMRPAPVNSLPREPPPRRGGAATKGGASSSRTAKNWSENEHNLFLVGMEIFGKGDWKNIAGKVVITKTHTQVASHAQKYFGRQQSSRKDRKRSSIHDINTVDPMLLLQVCNRLGRSLATTTMNYPPLLQHFRPTDHEGLP